MRERSTRDQPSRNCSSAWPLKSLERWLGSLLLILAQRSVFLGFLASGKWFHMIYYSLGLDYFLLPKSEHAEFHLVGGRMDPLFHDHAHVGPDFAELEPPSIDDVKKILGSIPSKSSNMDAIPTSLLKSCADIFAPLIARLAALSFREGQFPSRFKIASVTSLLKKPGLDSEVPGNYRPISNLNNISKILERLFLRNIIDHVSSSPSFNSSQSAYRKDHSTETALLRLLNDIYCAADRKSRSLLILLDLSAAFDTLDIGTLIRRLEHTFGIVGPALNWIKSYLTNRSQFVRVGGNRSAEVLCEYGVPQGSVLGPLLFTLYIAPVANVITSHGVSHLQYADDTQLYIALDKDESIEILQNCADAVYSWFAQNGLSLNPEKSEAILLGTGARLRREDRIPSVSFAETTVGTRTSVKSLGVTIDSGLTFNEHVDNICKASAYHIRSLRHIRKFINEDAATSVATALVSARIDYCNSLLYGTSKSNIDKLQRLQNSLARAVMCTGKFGSITPVLAALHWLPISARITYKVALLTRVPAQRLRLAHSCILARVLLHTGACVNAALLTYLLTQGVDHAATGISVVFDPCKSANQTVTTINSPGSMQHSTEDCVCESGFLPRGSCGLERTANLLKFYS